MSNAAAAYRDALSCPVCMETLTTPKMLTCGHSFCLTPCLTEIVKQHDPMCPLCRIPIVFPPSGEIEDLPTNFSVTGLLDVLRNTEDEDDTSHVTSNHTQKEGDYVCKTCLQQVCSCCQLSLHKKHDCILVSEFTEKLQHDVSKMVTVINEPSWSEETEPYIKDSAIMPTYCNLQEKIRIACNGILLSLSEKKLDLKKIKQLQKQVKKDHSKFKEAWESLKQESCDGKKQEEIKIKLEEYQVLLASAKFSFGIYKNATFRLRLLCFEKLKQKTEAMRKSLAKQMSTRSLDIRSMEDKLHAIGENIDVIFEQFGDIARDHTTFLFEEMGVPAQNIEPHYLLRVREAVEVMNFGSDRHSEDVMLECNVLVQAFQASKQLIRNVCKSLSEESHGWLLPLKISWQTAEHVLIEMANCKAYYEVIYDVIGSHFVNHSENVMKKCVKEYLVKLDTSYVLKSTSKCRTNLMKKHLTEFNRFKETTKTLCKALIREISEKQLSARDVHEGVKEIETRVERIKFHHQLLQNCSSIELRCHQIAEEFQKLLLSVQTMTAKIRDCHEQKEEVERLWKFILQREPTTILFDVDIFTTCSEHMTKNRERVATLLMLSNLDINDLADRMSKRTQIMYLLSQLRSAIGLPEVSRNLLDTHNRICQEMKTLHRVFNLPYKNSTSKTSYLQNWSLQDLLVLVNQAKACDNVFHEIRSVFEADCVLASNIASSMRYKLLERESHWLLELLIPYVERLEWNIWGLTLENNYQWKQVLDIVRSDIFDVNILKCRLDRAISLHNKVNNVSTKIFTCCVRKVLGVLAIILVPTIFCFVAIFYLEK